MYEFLRSRTLVYTGDMMTKGKDINMDLSNCVNPIPRFSAAVTAVTLVHSKCPVAVSTASSLRPGHISMGLHHAAVRLSSTG